MFGKRKLVQKQSDSLLSLRFTLPIIIETLFGIFINLIISGIISGISPSAMAATGMSNTVMTVIFAFFSIVIGSSAVIVSRHIGAGEGKEAGEDQSDAPALHRVQRDHHGALHHTQHAAVSAAHAHGGGHTL